MFTVIITEKGGEQRRMDFDKPEVTIGRVQGNDIILPKGNVSKRHSRIVLKDGKFIIVDLKSTNGTYVNGRKITSPLVLKETDKVYIGDFIITVEEPGAGRSASAGKDEPNISGTHTPIPPPVVPSGVYEPSSPPSAPSLVSNPPPVPRRPPGPPPMPPGRRAAPEEDVDLDGDLDDAPPPPPPRPSGVMATPPQPGPAPRVPPVAPRGSDRAAPVAPPPSLGRTTSREEVAPGIAAPVPVPVPAPRPVPVPPPVAGAPAPTSAPQPRVSPSAADGARPRATIKSFDVVAPPADVAAPEAPRHLELARELYDRVAAQLDLARVPLERLGDEALWQRAETALVNLVEQMEADRRLPAGVDQDALVKDTLNELLALGPLDDLLADDEVSEILVNRSDRVLVERGGRVVPAAKVFSSEAALGQILGRLLAPTGQRLDAASPLVDVRLPGGARVTAALPPLAVRGLAVTVRKPRRSPPSLDELVRGGALSQQMASFLATCVAARRNVLVCGGAAAGKTAFLAALAGLVPATERVVSVEEVAELALPNAHWIALEARPGAATYAEVVRAALRMRPDRLIVGEVRGVEALEVLSAFAAGAEGGFAAVAGDGAAPALARLESLARLAAPEASGRGLRELVAAATHIVVHVARYSDGVRRVASISEVTGAQGEGYALRELFQFQVQGHAAGSSGDPLRGRHVGAGVVPRFYSELEARGEKADSALFR